MEMSESIKDLACALAKAQGEMKNATKSSDNPYFKSKYADLAECLNVVREPLAKNGLSVFQANEGIADGKLAVTTLLMHSSGQYLKVTSSYPVQKNDPQGFGSTLTYARRYGLAAALGLAQDDDDGNAACQPQQQSKPQAKPKAQLQPTGNKFVKIMPNGDVQVLVKGTDKDGNAVGVYKSIKEETIEILEKMLTMEQYKLAHTAIKNLLAEIAPQEQTA